MNSAVNDIYDLPQTLRVLGFRSRQALHQSGLLGEHIHVRKLGRSLAFDAKDVDEWGRRLARRRILIRIGALAPTAPIVESPLSPAQDTTCPRCGRFALAREGFIWCEKKHRTVEKAR